MESLVMRPTSLSLASLAAALTLATGCVAPDASRDEASESSELAAAPNASAFVLTVSSDENGIVVTRPDGTQDKCGDFQQCQFAYIAGVTVSVKPRTPNNTIDCVHFDHWTGSCAGQGNPCSLTMNSDLTANAVWVVTRGCVPK
jgi:hypothetical protein